MAAGAREPAAMPHREPAAPWRACSFLFLVMMRRQRSPEQHRDDQRENDHFLERARPEGRKRFEESYQHRSGRRQWVARQAADDRTDEPFQTDEKPGIVVDGGDGSDQNARERPEQ